MNVESARLTFHGLIPVWFAVALGAAAAVGIFWLYFREHARVGPGRRAVMGLLRVLVVATVLFLLLRPVLVAETAGERPRGVALLVDNSLSMSQADQRLSAQDRLRVAIAENLVPPGTPVNDAVTAADVPNNTPENPTRAALVASVLSNPRLKLEEGLRRVGPLRVYLFGQRLRRLEDEEAGKDKKASAEPLVARLSREQKNDETRTALAEAVTDLFRRDDGDPPAAIVVVTDGQDNASRLTLEEAARECARLKIPLHVYGVGSSEVGNLQLKDFASPGTIFFDDSVSVPVRWRCSGFKEGAAEIVLTLGGQPVARREVALQEGEDFREVLTFTPRKDGGAEQKSELAVSIRHRGPETFTEDNELKRPVSVVDRKVKILYVENSPRWEYKFLQPALLRDRRVEPHFWLSGGDKRTLNSGPPYVPEFPPTRQELFSYDLLIMGDVPSAAIGAERIGWIRDFVREGGSLIFISGRQHAPASYHATPLAEVLPVEFVPVRASMSDTERPQPYVPVLTRMGERAEMLTLADTPEESQRVWQGLPGFYWHYPVSKLKPGAAALLVHPREKAGDQPAPILATHYYGKGQVVFLGTDETWRWRFNEENRWFGRFWGQLIYQMGLPHLIGAPKRVQLSLDRLDNTLGRTGYVYARVFTPEYLPHVADRMTGRLEKLDAKPGEERARSFVLDPVPGLAGEYRALLSFDAVGKYVVKVEDPVPASLEYRVSLPPQHELEVAGMNVAGLRAMAEAAGGKFYREEDLHQLAAALQPQQAKFTVRHEELLWNLPMFLLFLGLIAAEWIARKLSDLS